MDPGCAGSNGDIEMAEIQQVKYRGKVASSELTQALIDRVDAYFSDRNLSKHANAHMIAKTVLGFALWIATYLMIMSDRFSPAGLIAMSTAKRFAREVLRLVEAAPRSSMFGIHLCLGDLNNESLGNLVDAGPLVTMANAIMAEWPNGRTLDYIHAPFAHGERPPTMDPDYYEPLNRLWIPDRVRFIAGIIHEATTIKKLVQVRDQIEYNLNRRVDVAASCGLGGRTREAARLHLEIAKAVALAE